MSDPVPVEKKKRAPMSEEKKKAASEKRNTTINRKKNDERWKKNEIRRAWAITNLREKILRLRKDTEEQKQNQEKFLVEQQTVLQETIIDLQYRLPVHEKAVMAGLNYRICNAIRARAVNGGHVKVSLDEEEEHCLDSQTIRNSETKAVLESIGASNVTEVVTGESHRTGGLFSDLTYVKYTTEISFDWPAFN